jgi:RimJ/RimL family protein N-acetyltransferase
MTTYTLRELGAADIPELNRWRNDPEVIASLVAPFRHIGLEVDRDWYAQYLANRATAVRLAICHAPDDALVGAAYLTGIDWISRSAELGLWIGLPRHRGKGAGEFAARALLRHAFGDLNLHRVHLSVVADNAAAHSLYRKLGFLDEGRLAEAAFKNGRYVDLIRMAILEGAYRASQHTAAGAAEGVRVG